MKVNKDSHKRSIDTINQNSLMWYRRILYEFGIHKNRKGEYIIPRQFNFETYEYPCATEGCNEVVHRKSKNGKQFKCFKCKKELNRIRSLYSYYKNKPVDNNIL